METLPSLEIVNLAFVKTKQRIYLSPPFVSDVELNYVTEAMKSNWIAPTGPQLLDFEDRISAYSKIPYCLATVTGTSAIDLAIMALNIGPGDKVVVPTFTFAATVNPVFYRNAIPVFIESESLTWGMCPDTLQDYLFRQKSKNDLPKAIIIVHPYGNTAQIRKLVEVAQVFDIPVIEDAAAALGSTFDNQQVGTFGSMGIFSFNGNKIITTSQGGALLSSNKSHIDTARHVSMQAKIAGDGFEHDQIGYNYRLSNVLAAIGIGQIKTIEERVFAKRALYQKYKALLKDKSLIFQEEIPHARYNRWLSNVHFKDAQYLEMVCKNLKENNIEYRRLWKPLHLQSFCQGYEYVGNNWSENFFTLGLSLPSGLNLSEEEMDRVVGCF